MHFSTVMPVELRSVLEPLTSTRVSVKSWMQVGLWNGETEATVIGFGGTVVLGEELGLGVVVTGAVIGGAALVVDLVLVVLGLGGGVEVVTRVDDEAGGETGELLVLGVLMGVLVLVGGGGAAVVPPEHPPFAHFWPGLHTLQAFPSEHWVPGLSQHTASDA
jgi:hypothetical protein